MTEQTSPTDTVQTNGTATPEQARAAIADHPHWYHTVEVAPGVVTPGWFDLRPIVEGMPWPDVAGKRCLDVGTFDGFLAFELERRGASEVVALDIADPKEWDWPIAARESGPKIFEEFTQRRPRSGFEIATQLRGSSVVREDRNVYDLSPDEIGKFDVVVCGSLMLHLRDPIRALEAIRSVCSGVFLSAEAINLRLTVMHRRTPIAEFKEGEKCQWWVPNRMAHIRMLGTAGFDVEQTTKPYSIPLGEGHTASMEGGKLSTRVARLGKRAFSGGAGVPHVASVARPKPELD